MFSLADVMKFFAHKFARLRRGRFSFALVSARPLECLSFWHKGYWVSDISVRSGFFIFAHGVKTTPN
jgi:hypothetical protein